MICPKCKKENKSTNIRCEYCWNELNSISNEQNIYPINVKEIDLSGKKVGCFYSAFMMFFLAPWFLFGLIFTGVGTYSNITDYNKSKNYLEVKGKLVDYENCYYDDGDERCNAVYEYNVNGETYKGSPNLLSNRSGFKKIITVKYNPNNPSEYVMDSGWNILLIAGIIMMVIPAVIFIRLIKIKKIANNVKTQED